MQQYNSQRQRMDCALLRLYRLHGSWHGWQARRKRVSAIFASRCLPVFHPVVHSSLPLITAARAVYRLACREPASSPKRCMHRDKKKLGLYLSYMLLNRSGICSLNGPGRLLRWRRRSPANMDWFLGASTFRPRQWEKIASLLPLNWQVTDRLAAWGPWH